ncbi:MAG TPA: decaprenyl-phosphate phosphoribosyltransferase, partial [Candidatus Aminicenantes bacterium]|nr:decaprenyl-phosphate phosphoribosyltransferase [Candidatus Aminicenantes bacterium]
MSDVVLLKALRAQQWIKNLFIFGPLLFSQNLSNGPLLYLAFRAFVAFCMISSAQYIFNDIRDLEEDRSHPIKSLRPLASGRMKMGLAVALLIGMGLGGFLIAATISLPFLLIAIGYFVLQALYTVWLKHIVILDVFIIAAGFLIRVIAGGLAVDVEISSWLLICTILLSLFLALGKRRYELTLLQENASNHRP